jgi:hypothetical protein
MKEKEDYIKDIAEMRSIMERSTRFLSLSGVAVILIGLYALIGVFIAYQVIGYDPRENNSADTINKLLGLGAILMSLSIVTVIFLSFKKASRNNEKFWNPTFRRLLIHVLTPLLSGGILILILVSKELANYIIPLSLIFYGLTLHSSGKFSYPELQFAGLISIMLGLFAACFIQYSLGCWAIGFSLMHIGLGMYLHFRYER